MKTVLLGMIRFYRRYLSPPPPYLPVHSHLLGLCHGGHRKVWRLEGGLAGGAPDPPV